MKIPTTLKHKPVITVENYENVDGRTAYQSDAKGLSLGLAQWNDRGRVDISGRLLPLLGSGQPLGFPSLPSLIVKLIYCPK